LKNRKAKLAIFFLTLGLILASGLSLRGQVTGQSPALPYLQNGDRFYEQGKYKEALAEYQKALSLDPKNQYAQFQIGQIQKKTGIGMEPGAYEILPPRDYSKLSYELGPYYKDPVNSFAIKYPKGWSLDNTDPNFTAKFIEPYSEAYIFVKVIPAAELVLINYEFRDQVEAEIKKLLEQVPGASLRYCNFEKFLNDTALKTEIVFKTGPNNSLIGTRYISDINRLILVSYVCQEKLFFTFRPLLESSIATLNLNPR